jgi:SAD/SRA domain
MNPLAGISDEIKLASKTRKTSSPRKRKAPTDNAAYEPRRSIRRKTSTGKYVHEELDDDYESDEFDYKKDITHRERALKQAGTTERVIGVRHADGTLELAEGDGLMTPSESENSPGPVKKPAYKAANKDLERAKVFGSIGKIKVGQWYPGRQDFHNALVHRGLVQGIFGDHNGAYSIAVSGGYEDDVDQGYSLSFTGEGGRHLNKDHKTGQAKNLRMAPQSKDQGWSIGNIALRKSLETGEPVRVIRGFKGMSTWAPRAGYRYDGVGYPISDLVLLPLTRLKL